MAEIGPSKRSVLLDYLLCYALYALLIICGVVVVFVIWRNAIVAMIAAFMGRSEANRIVYLGSMLLLGLGLFILVMAAEPYLRHGVERRQLLRRFGRLALPLLIAGGLGLLLLAIV